MRTLGLLGGMTHHSTSTYYTLINNHVQTRLGGLSSATLLLYSFNHAETSTLFMKGQWDTVTTKFVSVANHFKAAGAQAIVICCNTGHHVADEVERLSGLPLLHIADYTGILIRKVGVERVVLLGTKPVMEGTFFIERLRERFGIEVVVPELKQREDINALIFGDLARNVATPASKEFLLTVIRECVDRGAQGVVLACTELGFLIKAEDLDVPVWDTMAAHAIGVAEWALESQ